jgi:hypothetical protein
MIEESGHGKVGGERLQDETETINHSRIEEAMVVGCCRSFFGVTGFGMG